MRYIVGWLTVLLAGGASGLAGQIAPTNAKHARTLTVTSPLSQRETAARLARVLVGREYTIDRADGTAIISAPRLVKNDIALTLRANVLPHATGSAVTLSGTYDIPSLGVKGQPVEAGRPRLQGELWGELEAVVAALGPVLAD